MYLCVVSSIGSVSGRTQTNASFIPSPPCPPHYTLTVGTILIFLRANSENYQVLERALGKGRKDNLLDLYMRL